MFNSLKLVYGGLYDMCNKVNIIRISTNWCDWEYNSIYMYIITNTTHNTTSYILCNCMRVGLYVGSRNIGSLHFCSFMIFHVLSFLTCISIIIKVCIGINRVPVQSCVKENSTMNYAYFKRVGLNYWRFTLFSSN